MERQQINTFNNNNNDNNKSSLSSHSQRASFLAAEAPRSGDWLFTLPIASCGLKLEDEAAFVLQLPFG